MNRQNIKKHLPSSLINSRRFLLRKARNFKKYLHNFGKPYFYKVNIEAESFFIQINPYKNGCVDEIIESEGFWEPALTNTLKGLLKKGDTFLDIGANIGYHSIAIANALPEVEVFSFEPQDSLCKQIESSIKKNNLKNVTLFQVGLSDIAQEVFIHIPEENVGGSSIIPGLSSHPSYRKSTKIKLETLDSFANRVEKLNLLKIDVEGLELQVLKGGRELILQQKPVIVMEFSPIIYNQYDKSMTQNLINYLSDLGYEIFDLELKKMDINAWLAQADNSTNGQVDIVCIPLS